MKKTHLVLLSLAMAFIATQSFAGHGRAKARHENRQNRREARQEARQARRAQKAAHGVTTGAEVRNPASATQAHH